MDLCIIACQTPVRVIDKAYCFFSFCTVAFCRISKILSKNIFPRLLIVFILLPNVVSSYLHTTLSPPVAHSNLKAANILLDEELMPRVCDCGLAILRPLTSNRVKIKVSTFENHFILKIC